MERWYSYTMNEDHNNVIKHGAWDKRMQIRACAEIQQKVHIINLGNGSLLSVKFHLKACYISMQN